MLPPHHQTPVVPQPRERPPHLPALAVRRRVARRWAASPWLPARRPPLRRDRVADTPPGEIAPERSAVVAPVARQPLRPRPWTAPPPGDGHRLQRRLGQPHLCLLRALDEHSDGEPVPVGNRHDLRAFALARQPHAGAPLFAGTKVPSKNASA